MTDYDTLTENERAAMVAEAVATERERCAKIAERIGVLEAAPADEFERGLHEAALRIAADIRAHQ